MVYILIYLFSFFTILSDFHLILLVGPAHLSLLVLSLFTLAPSLLSLVQTRFASLRAGKGGGGGAVSSSVIEEVVWSGCDRAWSPPPPPCSALSINSSYAFG